jgi:hypothetical protein
MGRSKPQLLFDDIETPPLFSARSLFRDKSRRFPKAAKKRRIQNKWWNQLRREFREWWTA